MIKEYLNRSNTEGIKYITELKEKILNSTPCISKNEQDFNCIYTDGSFDVENKKRGAAVVIIREKSKEIIQVNTHIARCYSSTHAELNAAFMGLVIANNYENVSELKTDSTAIVNGRY